MEHVGEALWREVADLRGVAESNETELLYCRFEQVSD